MKPNQELTYILLALLTFTGIFLLYKVLVISLITRAALVSWNIT